MFVRGGSIKAGGHHIRTASNTHARQPASPPMGQGSGVRRAALTATDHCRCPALAILPSQDLPLADDDKLVDSPLDLSVISIMSYGLKALLEIDAHVTKLEGKQGPKAPGSTGARAAKTSKGGAAGGARRK